MSDKGKKHRKEGRGASFLFAFRGMRVLVGTQPNARIHLIAMGVLGVTGAVLKISVSEWAILALSAGGVLALEAMNTALEFLADRVSGEWDPLIQNAKDVAAAAVLIAAITAVIVGNLIFLPRFFLLLSETGIGNAY